MAEAGEQRTFEKLSHTLEGVHASGLKRDWVRVGKLLEELPVRKLPPELLETSQVLRLQANRLQHLEGLHALIGGMGQEKLAVNALEQQLASLLEATDEELTIAVRKFLAYRALRRGDVEAAVKLLRADCTVEGAPALLRDLRRTVGNEEATVSRLGSRSAPVERLDPFLPDSRPPLLVPIADAAGWRPSVIESARSGLPPLEDVGTAEKKVCKSLTTSIQTHIGKCQAIVSPYLDQASKFGREAKTLATKGPTSPLSKEGKREQSDPMVSAVAKELQRTLTPAEHLLVNAMRGQGKNVEQITSILRGLDKTQPKP
jgi:hypothetical protein